MWQQRGPTAVSRYDVETVRSASGRCRSALAAPRRPQHLPQQAGRGDVARSQPNRNALTTTSVRHHVSCYLSAAFFTAVCAVLAQHTPAAPDRRHPVGENAEIRHTCDVVPCSEIRRMVHSRSESGFSLPGWRCALLARLWSKGSGWVEPLAILIEKALR